MEKIHYIREIMQRQGLSLSQLADKLGGTKSAVASYLVHDIRLSKANNIAKALGVPLPSLFIEPTQYGQDNSDESAKASLKCPECGAKLNITLEKESSNLG